MQFSIISELFPLFNVSPKKQLSGLPELVPSNNTIKA